MFLSEVVRGEKDLAVAAGEELYLSRNSDFPQKIFQYIILVCNVFEWYTMEHRRSQSYFLGIYTTSL